MKKIVALVLCLSGLFSCSPLEKNNFLTGEKNRARVESDFSQKMELVGEQFFDTVSLHPTLAETEALKFLYAYMPLGDVTDYSTAFYLENVRTAFKAREEMEWGKTIPELIFRHFVLPLRVNNENLDDFRTLYYEELKERSRLKLNVVGIASSKNAIFSRDGIDLENYR